MAGENSGIAFLAFLFLIRYLSMKQPLVENIGGHVSFSKRKERREDAPENEA